MRISRDLKQKLQFLLLRIVIGQVSDLGALIEALEAITLEAKIQNGQQT